MTRRARSWIVATAVVGLVLVTALVAYAPDDAPPPAECWIRFHDDFSFDVRLEAPTPTNKAPTSDALDGWEYSSAFRSGGGLTHSFLLPSSMLHRFFGFLGVQQRRSLSYRSEESPIGDPQGWQRCVLSDF